MYESAALLPLGEKMVDFVAARVRIFSSPL